VHPKAYDDMILLMNTSKLTRQEFVQQFLAFLSQTTKTSHEEETAKQGVRLVLQTDWSDLAPVTANFMNEPFWSKQEPEDEAVRLFKYWLLSLPDANFIRAWLTVAHVRENMSLINSINPVVGTRAANFLNMNMSKFASTGLDPLYFDMSC
jgi:hypothetical protein